MNVHTDTELYYLTIDTPHEHASLCNLELQRSSTKLYIISHVQKSRVVVIKILDPTFVQNNGENTVQTHFCRELIQVIKYYIQNTLNLGFVFYGKLNFWKIE